MGKVGYLGVAIKSHLVRYKNFYTMAIILQAIIIVVLVIFIASLEEENLQMKEIIEEGLKEKEATSQLSEEVEFIASVINSFDFDRATEFIEPQDPDINALANQLDTPENIYNFVRDEVIYSESAAHTSASSILMLREGDCVGQSNLLASLYRARGVPQQNVHVAFGTLNVNNKLLRHAWVELKHNNRWIVLDSTTILGTFSFDRWGRESFYKTFNATSWIDYNDQYSHINSLYVVPGNKSWYYLEKGQYK